MPQFTKYQFNSVDFANSKLYYWNGGNYQTMTKTQKLLITILALLFIAVLVGFGVLIWPNITSTLSHPTVVVIEIPATNTEISYPTAPPIEQSTATIRVIKKPTGTPYYTPIPMLTHLTPTKISISPTISLPQTVAAYSAPVKVKPDCSAQYNYILAVHQYYLDYINYTYNLEISYYQPLLNQALRERDARIIIQIQEEINQIKTQRDAAIKSENTRYAADKASLNAQCG
jgi:hypothetical protein